MDGGALRSHLDPSPCFVNRALGCQMKLWYHQQPTGLAVFSETDFYISAESGPLTSDYEKVNARSETQRTMSVPYEIKKKMNDNSIHFGDSSSSAGLIFITCVLRITISIY